MVRVRNIAPGPRGAYVKAEGAEFALVEVWADPGKVIEADDFDENWFVVVSGKEAGPAKSTAGDDAGLTPSDEEILAAVGELDEFNDDHWTKKGEPSVDAVSEVLDFKVSRSDIERAAPDAVRPEIGD